MDEKQKIYYSAKVGDIFDEAQEQFLELKFNSAAKDKFKVLDFEAFWVKYLPVYHLLLRHTNKF